MLNIPEADNINHIVVFLTDTISLPLGMAGGVYFSWPDTSAPPNWQFLGYISNSKPSAIFKISQLKKLDEMETSNGAMSNAQYNVFGVQPISHSAQIGVSIEPESNIMQLVPATVSFIKIISKLLSPILMNRFFLNLYKKKADKHKSIRSIWTKNAGEFLQFCIEFCT